MVILPFVTLTEMRSKRCISTLLICMILFAKLYEAKGSPQTREVKSSSSNTRREVRLLIRNPITRNGRKWKKFARDFGIRLTEFIRRAPLEKKKRRKRQPGLIQVSPTNKRIVRLQSKTGFFLEILPNGNVGGHINKTKYTEMEMQVIAPHLKRIRGVATGRYLGINQNGKVISKVDPDPETYFYETISENYDHLLSSVRYPICYKNSPWYLAIRRKHGKRGIYGKTKRASRTFAGDIATRFSILNT